METENYESFAAQVNFATEEEMALADAPVQVEMTDEELDDLYNREMYQRSVAAVNPHLAEAMG
jgi:hypothetical protein